MAGLSDEANVDSARESGVRDIREYGKYLFCRDEERYRGYASDYNRKVNRGNAKTGKEESAPVSA